jgi:plasmid stabilization system protein ParE
LVARIELAPGVLEDFDRIFDHWARFDPDAAPQRIAQIVQAVQILADHPLIGRRKDGSKRELVIGQGSRGYLALYRYVADIDTVFVLAIRSQRESGYASGR